MQRKTEEKDRKQKTGKVEHRKRKRLKRIGSEKTKMEKYVSFREQIATKERRKKTTELRSARYICAGEISSRDPSERSQDQVSQRKQIIISGLRAVLRLDLLIANTKYLLH